MVFIYLHRIGTFLTVTRNNNAALLLHIRHVCLFETDRDVLTCQTKGLPSKN